SGAPAATRSRSSRSSPTRSVYPGGTGGPVQVCVSGASGSVVTSGATSSFSRSDVSADSSLTLLLLPARPDLRPPCCTARGCAGGGGHRHSGRGADGGDAGGGDSASCTSGGGDSARSR